MILTRIGLGCPILVLVASLASSQTAVAQAASITTAPAIGTATAGSIVQVTAVDYAFRAPEVIPAGWTTIRFQNDGAEHHMVFMSRLPEGKTVEDYQTDISDQFSVAWDAMMAGEADGEQALGMIFAGLPEWFPELHFPGGPGLIAPGLSSEVTLYLEPGNYVLECYVKAEDGTIHYMDGMIAPVEVRDPSDAALPLSDIRVTLSNFDLAVQGNLTAGRRTVAVHVKENPEQGFGHSVHVARLEPGVDVDEVVAWLNWVTLDGMRTPAPVHFIGGSHPMPADGMAYFTVDLEPGRYLFISEATGALGVREVVTVR